MKTILESKKIVLIPENEEERILLEIWINEHEQQVFSYKNAEQSLVLTSRGLENDACRVPINIFNTVEAKFSLISNFAHTPFELHGLRYESVEGFWQGLKFEKASDRRLLAQMWGGAAKKATKGLEQPVSFVYMGRTILAGTHEHHALMYEANVAKFTQHEAAKNALLATNSRPIIHKLRRDSRTIPGAVMGDIWMRVRKLIAGD